MGSTCAGWLPALAERGRPRPAPHAALHPALDERRAEPDRHVRHEARPRQRRRSSRKSPPRRRACGSASTCRSSREHADRLAVVRSLSTKEGDHARGTHLVRTGHPPMGDGRVSVDRLLAGQGAQPTASQPLPNYVSVAPLAADQSRGVRPGISRRQLRPGDRRPAAPRRSAASSSDAATATDFADLKLDDLELPSDVDAHQAVAAD